MSMLCGERKEDFVLMIVTNATGYMGGHIIRDHFRAARPEDNNLPNRLLMCSQVV